MDDPMLDCRRHEAALRGLSRLNYLSGSARSIWPSLAALARQLDRQQLRVLDVATGAGDVPVRLWRMARRAGLHLEIHGLDVSPRAVEFAARRAAAEQAAIHFSVLDVLAGLLPDCEEAMTWRIGNHGFEMTLSSRVPELIARYLRPWLEAWLKAEGLSLAAIGSWAIHPGGPRIIESVAAALDLPASATAVSAEILAECGNMSSTSVLFVLDRLQQVNAPRPCVALAFGPGLVAEAALIV